MDRKSNKAPQKEGVQPQERCDRIASEFKQLLQSLNISNDDYVRTTETRHKNVVSHLLKDLLREGRDLYCGI